MIRTYHNNEHDVTVEIASRQSGKTTRLINDAIAHAIAKGEDAKIMIVGCNHDTSSFLRVKLNERIDELGLSRRVRNQFIVQNINIFGTQIETSLRRFNTSDNNKIYFDEFEFMDNVPALPKAYYTSSIHRRLRESHTFNIITTFGGQQLSETENEFISNYMIEVLNSQQPDRTLRGGGWAFETPFEISEDLRTMHGLDLETELTDILRAEAYGIAEKLNELDSYLDRLGV